MENNEHWAIGLKKCLISPVKGGLQEEIDGMFFQKINFVNKNNKRRFEDEDNPKSICSIDSYGNDHCSIGWVRDNPYGDPRSI